MIRRIAPVAYGLVVYAFFLGVFVYTAAFLANAAWVRGIDEGATRAAGTALLVNAGLLGAFAAQHTVMARPGFKRWWSRFVPDAIERSTFVLAATLVLAAVVWLWQPMPTTVWSVETGWLRAVLWAGYFLGWVTVVGSTFMINHFELFGLSQVVARARRRTHVPPSFQLRWLYRFVRHPIMLGFLIAFWATPDMSQGRLLFAALGTGYIVVGVRFEERDLRASLGEDYARYEAAVPRFFPRAVGRPLRPAGGTARRAPSTPT